MLSRARKNVAGVVLWSLWIGSALQPVALAWEFWGLELQHCGWEAWYYARFYSHMFVYPVTFGLLSTWFLQRPFREVLDYLRKNRKLFIEIIVLILVVVVAASCAEFSKSTGAIWEFSPEEVLQKYPSAHKAREILNYQCWAAKTTEERYSDYLGDSPTEDPYYDYLDELSFKQLLQNIKEEAGILSLGEIRTFSELCAWLKAYSLTRVAYFFGFIAMSALFMILFVTFFITLAFKEDLVKQDTLSRLTNALFFASFWVLMRITFMVEKFTVFNVEDDQLFIFNFFIFLLFLFALANLLTALKNESYNGSDKFKYDSLSIVGVMELLLSITGFANQMLDTHHMPHILVHLFGTRSNGLTYFFIGLLLFLLFFPSTLRACYPLEPNQASKKPFEP